jgi:penicillin-binding protein 1C
VYRIDTYTTGGPSILTAIPIQDSTDEGFRGLVSVRTALAGSLNIPAVRTLGLVGAQDFIQQLQRLGLNGANELGDCYGPSLALGSVDASLWELL